MDPDEGTFPLSETNSFYLSIRKETQKWKELKMAVGEVLPHWR